MHPTVYDLPLCPVDGCTQPHAEDVWALANTPGKITLAAPAHGAPTIADIDAAITASVVGRAAAVENLLRQHLESHDVLDFVRTIHHLRCQLDEHRADLEEIRRVDMGALQARLAEFKNAGATAPPPD